MNPFRSNVGTLNEILFENKNKSYGAYVIRKAYNSTVFKSLGLSVAIIFLFMGLLMILCSTDVIPEEKIPDTGTDSTITVEFHETPLKKLADPVQHSPAMAAAQHNAQTVATVITDNNRVDTTHFDPNAVANTQGTATTTVDPTNISPTGTNTAIAPTSTLTGGGSPTTTVYIPEVWPEFTGSLKKFWADNIHYPRAAVDGDIQGKVGINFVIDENGKVIDAKVIHKLGYGCDEEVLRVIKLMPAWKPGKMGGKAVRVSFNQAVDFKLQ